MPLHWPSGSQDSILPPAIGWGSILIFKMSEAFGSFHHGFQDAFIHPILHWVIFNKDLIRTRSKLPAKHHQSTSCLAELLTSFPPVAWLGYLETSPEFPSCTLTTWVISPWISNARCPNRIPAARIRQNRIPVVRIHPLLLLGAGGRVLK